MQRRMPYGKGRLRGLTLAATAGVAAAALASAGTSDARTATAAGAGTIHVIEHAVTDTEIPTGGGTDVKGNILTFNNPIFNAANSKRVGRDEGFCTRLAPAQGIWECMWTTFLKRGQITVQGPFYDKRNSTMSITGGTGAYRTARGQMRLLSRNGGKAYDFIFQLS